VLAAVVFHVWALHLRLLLARGRRRPGPAEEPHARPAGRPARVRAAEGGPP